jgi:hypothetical protein
MNGPAFGPNPATTGDILGELRCLRARQAAWNRSGFDLGGRRGVPPPEIDVAIVGAQGHQSLISLKQKKRPSVNIA